MKFHHRFLPHHHQDQHHRAHAISPFSLFLYLQLLAVFAAGIYLIRLTSPNILGTATFSAQEVIAITNQKRAENNLRPLAENSFLEQAARAKAVNMFAENYWAHFAPSGKSPWFFIKSAGYKYLFAGENLARDFTDAQSIVNAWMDSPAHRTNILDKNFKDIGVAVADGKLTGREGVLVVQMFGARAGNLSFENSSVTSGSERKGLIAVNVPSSADAKVRVLASRQFAISKVVSLSLVGFIFALFALETMILVRRAKEHLGGGVLAHVGVLGFLLLAVWYSVSGAII